VCELARTSLETAQRRLRTSSSPNFWRTQGSVNLAKKPRGQPARHTDEEITGSLDEAADNVTIWISDSEIVQKTWAEQKNKRCWTNYHSKATRGIWARAVSSRRLVLQGNRCLQIVIFQSRMKPCVPLHPALLPHYVKRLSGILKRRNISSRDSPNSEPHQDET